MKPLIGKPIAARIAATAGLIAALTSGPAQAQGNGNPLILLTKANGVVCSQISQVACWADRFTGAPSGRLPRADEWAMLGGDNAIQGAGQSHAFQILHVIWLKSFIGQAAFPSHFTQYGQMTSQLLSVDDGSYTVAGANARGRFGWVTVGRPIQGARPNQSLRNPVLEVRGGVVEVGLMNVGQDEFSQDSRSSGEVRLTGGTLKVSGAMTGAGVAPQFVSSRLFVDGGQLEARNIQNFTELHVGSTAGRVGHLQRKAGETASTGLLAVGVEGGTGSLQLTGAGAQLTARQAVLGSGPGGSGEVSMADGALLSAREMVIGARGTLKLHNGGMQADTMQVAAGGIVAIDLTGADPSFETGHFMLNGLLHFEGRLELNFLNGFAPVQGQRIQLFGFDGFSGRLGAAQVVVTGFDAAQLDFSRLAVDGSIAAVPEPATTVLWLLGLGGLMVAAQRRRRLVPYACVHQPSPPCPTHYPG
ncbi:MAG: PEP-CTERM sorting domain-containing protein [Aquabacterium sp.]